MIYFISDTHFYHYKDFLRRPFLGPEMDELLINNWNSVVKPSDEVWHIGDFGYRLKEDQGTNADKLIELKTIFERLNGSRHLILGNHDRPNKVDKLKWASIHDTHMLSWPDGNRFFLSHYAHRTWPSKHHGTFHLYGHSHGKMPGFERSMDVGVDADQYKQKYFPISVEEVIKQLSPIKFESKEDLNREEQH